MKNIFSILLVLLFISCQNKEEKKEALIMVEQSEMAALMLQMYAINKENKDLILKGEKPKAYPKEFNKIHSAVLTDQSDRDAAFKAYSDFHLKNVKALYNTTNIDSLILQHNTVVNSCITCHEVKCLGPIPKIKKLLIN